MKGAIPIESEPKNFGVEDFARVLGAVNLGVIDSVEATIGEGLSRTEPCVEKSGREGFFARRSVGRFLRLEDRKEEPNIAQNSMRNQVSCQEQRNSLAIDKPCDSAVNQCTDSLSENLCGSCQSETQNRK